MAAGTKLADGMPDEIGFDFTQMDRSRPRQEEPGGTGYEVQPGVYDAVVAACKPRLRTNSGEEKKNIEWVMEITRGPNTDAADGKAVGARLWRYTTWDPQALFALDQVLFACGYTDEELQGKGKFKRSRCLGKPVRIQVGSGEYQGKYRAQLNGVFRPASPNGSAQGPQASQEAAGDPFGGGGVASQPTEEEPPF